MPNETDSEARLGIGPASSRRYRFQPPAEQFSALAYLTRAGICYPGNAIALDEIPAMIMPKTPPEKKDREEGEVERVYKMLLEWVVTAQLPPGEFLSEPDLAKRCDTSRTPIREACSRLAQDGWLSLIRRKGWVVTPISVRDIVEMYEYRKILECYTAEKAARSASGEQIDHLRSIVAIETQPTATLPEILRANSAIHLRLAELSSNRRVVAELTRTLRYVRRLDTLCTQTVPGWIGHEDIIAAIEAHDPERARSAMAIHIDSTVEKMIKLFSSADQNTTPPILASPDIYEASLSSKLT
jgi:DNA-binding GntR family transcriptional regulator